MYQQLIRELFGKVYALVSLQYAGTTCERICLRFILTLQRFALVGTYTSNRKR